MLNPIALRKAKIVYNFGLSECNRVKALKVKIDELANSIVPDDVAHNEFYIDITLKSYTKGQILSKTASRVMVLFLCNYLVVPCNHISFHCKFLYSFKMLTYGIHKI